MAELTSRRSSLYFGYPCSVDAGVDPVEYTEKIIDLCRELEKTQQDTQRLREDLVRLIPGCSMNSTYEQLIKNAGELRKSWGYAVYEDKTMMESDMHLVAKCSVGKGFIEQAINKYLVVIEEFRDEHITNVQAFLSCISPAQDGTIRFLCLCGHGLSEKAADNLRSHPADDGTKKSTVWDWYLYDCKDPEGMNQEASEITMKARKGDVAVFSSGLLTPEWVVAKLGDCEDNLRSRKEMVQNTIVIVIDACYSGMWRTRMQQCLTTKPLDFTRVILQTSCGEDEVSYGCYFMPVFCALQDDNTRTKILEAYKTPNSLQGKVDELFDHESQAQTPTVYDSSGAVNRDGLPVCESFHFVNNADFLTFCLKYLTVSSLENARGIPDDDLDSFFNSFQFGESPEIRCFKLTKHSSGSPMAFFLMPFAL